MKWENVFKSDMEAETFHQEILDKTNEKQSNHFEETKKMLNESVDYLLKEFD